MWYMLTTPASFFSAETCDDAVSIANETLMILGKWSTSNGLKINIPKTKAIWSVLKVDHCTLHVTLLTIALLSKCKLIQNVRYNIHENIYMDSHLDDTITKLFRVCQVVCRNQLILASPIKFFLYNTLFHSHLNCCQLVWGTTTKTNLEKVFLLQDKMLRIISNVPFTILRIFYLRSFKWLKYFLISTATDFVQGISLKTNAFFFKLSRPTSDMLKLRYPIRW